MAQVLQQLIAVVQDACAVASFKTGELQKPSDSGVRFAILSYAQRLLAENWKFLEDEKTDLTVSGTAAYTLSGNSYNCAKVIYLSYDGHDFRTHYCDPEEFARYYDADIAETVAVSNWTVKGFSAKNNPIVTFFGTPMETGKAIFYRFKKIVDPNDPLALLPPDMIDVVVAKMISRFHPSAQEKQAAAQEWIESLAAAQERWRPEIGLPRETQIPEEQMERNYEINMAMGDHAPGGSAGRVVDGSLKYLR